MNHRWSEPKSDLSTTISRGSRPYRPDMNTTYDTATGTVRIPTWTRGTVLKVWAAAAVPMGILAWVVAPLLAKKFSGPAALPQALTLTLAAGLIWQFVSMGFPL